MTRLSIGAGWAVLDVVSVGCVIEHGSLCVVMAMLAATSFTVWPWANELSDRLLRGDES